MKYFKSMLCLGLLLWSAKGFSLTFQLPTNGDNVVGKVQWTQSLPGDDFITVGRRYDIGYYELVEANPGVDPNLPHPGTLLVIPSRFVIPNVPHKGIVVSLAELRIYYFPAGTNEVKTYPVGIGREGWNTPIGVTTVTQKVVNPTWVVPPDIMAWRLEKENGGVQLPKSVPPGPNNPLGGYALYLGFPEYHIHGTNDPTGIGRRSSSGCIRMWPEDIEELFSKTPKGTTVRVINDPFKAGWLDNRVYLESHTPLEEQQHMYQTDAAPMRYDVQDVVANRPAEINWSTAKWIAKQQNGVPQIIGFSK